MLKRLGIAAFLGCLIDAIEQRTGRKCYDDPNNKESPFFAVQVTKTEPRDTKTAYVDAYEVWVHCIGEPTQPYSNAPVLALVQELEEALTEDIDVPAPFQLLRQVYNGLQTLKEDESHEGHAVLGYSFHICYGYRVK